MARRLAPAALMIAGLAACVHPFTPPPADVASPLAADIDKMNLKDAAYPSWLSVPGRPTDVRPVTAWTRNIYNTLRVRREMQALAVLYPQSLYGAEAFAQQTRNSVQPPVPPAESTAQTAATAAFANQGRERATPPPPAQ